MRSAPKLPPLELSFISISGHLYFHLLYGKHSLLASFQQYGWSSQGQLSPLCLYLHLLIITTRPWVFGTRSLFCWNFLLPQTPFTNFAGHSRATRSTAQELRLYLCQSTCHERETGKPGQWKQHLRRSSWWSLSLTHLFVRKTLTLSILNLIFFKGW